ncbi:MAG: hypothetical protein KJ645_07940, partial [Planctomycetes bacterium]|nr:hypothetical protein [Planctomycetota bacterium]
DDVTFAQSSPRFYAWMEEHHPEVFMGIREKVKAGRWELLGGMWIEPDGNMPCGEALVRQRLYGQRYYLEKFGRLSEVAWVPDTFGMHRNHPQIIRKTGGRYFFTTKLMWNYEIPFPFQHFVWEAADGSQVLALQSAVGCGEGPGPREGLEASVSEKNVLLLPGTQARLSYRDPAIPDHARSSEIIPEVLVIYGEGDGGEGPSDRHFIRAQNLARLPGYRNGKVHDHFHRIDAKYRDRLPVWADELYLENHRGTTTSQGRIKELNRRGEVAVLCAEKWASLRRLIDGTGVPKKRLDRIWKKLLFNQFHDILPGTSVPQAYVDVELDFDDVLRTAEEIQRHALRGLASRISTVPLDAGGRPVTFSTGRTLILFNPLSWTRPEIVCLPWGYPHVKVLDPEGRPLPSQVIFRDGENRLCFQAEVPPMGYTQVRLVAGGVSPAWEGVKVHGRTAESRFYRLELDEEGNIARLFDKELGKELLSGPANRIRFYKNHPREWSNWNLDPEYEKHELVPEGPVSIEIMDAGPVVGAYRITRPAVDGGRIVEEIRLYRDHKRIDFILDLDVRYRESLIKAEFPLKHDARIVKTEIAYGTHDRPVIPQNDFERAQWEVWTQKWFDLSGEERGITFLNSAKYAFDVKGDRVRLTLVKGGIMPDNNTDLCTHRIDYALLSHARGFEEAHAWRWGYEYNFPVQALLEEEHHGPLPAAGSFGAVSAENVCWEVIKPEEDGPGMLLRVFEVEGKDVDRVELKLPCKVNAAEEVDFLEREVIRKLEIRENRITFALGHHEIKAVRVFAEPSQMV